MEPVTIAPATIVPAPPAPVDAATALEQFTVALTNNGWQELHRYLDRTLIGVCSKNGNGHYKYVAEAGLIANTNDTAIDVWRYRPDGSLDTHVSIPFPTEAGAAFKGEAGVLWLEIEGTDLVLYLAFHLAIQGVRPGVTAIYSLRGFVVDPYPQGQVPMGASFELAGLPGAGGGGEPTPSGLSDADKAWLQTQLDAGFAGLVRQFGGTGIRDGIMQKAKDALVANLDPNNHDTWAAAYQYVLWLFMNNRIYEQGMKVGHELLGHGPAGLEVADVAPYDVATGAAALDAWRQFAANEDTTASATGEHTNAEELEGK